MRVENYANRCIRLKFDLGGAHVQCCETDLYYCSIQVGLKSIRPHSTDYID